MNQAPPRAQKRNKTLSIHGDQRVDPWYWMQDIDDAAVSEYINDENTYTKRFLDKSKSLNEKIFSELKGRLKEDDKSIPYKEGNYWYFSEIKKGEQYPVYKRSSGSESENIETILDLNELAKGHDFFELGFCENSPDHKLLAYSVDISGNEEYTIFIKDLSNGKIIDEEIKKNSGCFEWFNDSKSFLYGLLDENHRPKWIYSHTLGENQKKDQLILEESDSRFNLSVDKSESERFLFVCSEGNNMSEWHYLDASSVNKDLKIIQERENEHEYDVSDHGEDFYIVTNHEAPDYKVVKTSISTPSRANWEEFIPHKKGVQIEGFCFYKNYIAIQERKNCVPGLRIYTFESKKFSNINFDENIFEISLLGSREYDSDLLRYSFQSLKCTPEIYDYNMKTGENTLKKKSEISDKSFNEKNYEQKLIYVKSHDGKDIPVSLVYRKDSAPSEKSPLMLSGYGAYGISKEPVFSSNYLTLLDRGFVIALAHVRGGLELGRDWYLEGKMLNKKNTFLDYISCAEYLIENKYTSKGSILASGGSAGGMLMGYVANERPELFKAIIAHVPFVDVLTTMLDETLPLTAGEFNEWGNPKEKEYYEYIKSYSPYDNVKKQDYPAMLIVAGIEDTRVTYWEPTKWVAKLRENQTNKDNPILLKMQMDSGHGGASGRYDFLEEVALDLTFVLNIFEIPFDKD